MYANERSKWKQTNPTNINFENKIPIVIKVWHACFGWLLFAVWRWNGKRISVETGRAHKRLTIWSMFVKHDRVSMIAGSLTEPLLSSGSTASSHGWIRCKKTSSHWQRQRAGWLSWLTWVSLLCSCSQCERTCLWGNRSSVFQRTWFPWSYHSAALW